MSDSEQTPGVATGSDCTVRTVFAPGEVTLESILRLMREAEPIRQAIRECNERLENQIAAMTPAQANVFIATISQLHWPGLGWKLQRRVHSIAAQIFTVQS